MANKKITFEDGEKIRSNKETKKKTKRKVRRKKAKKRNFVGIIIFFVILAIIIGIIGFIWGLVAARLKNLNIVEIDKADLEVNENLLQELDGRVTEEEFEDIITVVLFGSDSRNTENMSDGRADSIIVASLNPASSNILRASFDKYARSPLSIIIPFKR